MAKRKIEVQVEATEIGTHEGSGLPLHSWVVTTNTGYRATIAECPCGLWRELGANTQTGKTYGHAITNCTCRSEACRRKPVSRSHVCHGWHQARVDKLVSDLAKQTGRHTVTPPPRASYAPWNFVRVPELDGRDRCR
jgi:hypothetical protein